MSSADKQNIKACSVCEKPIKDINVLTEVSMEAFCWYVREDGLLEDMNGLGKMTKEFFCEECFDSFVEAIEKIQKKRLKNN